MTKSDEEEEESLSGIRLRGVSAGFSALVWLSSHWGTGEGSVQCVKYHMLGSHFNATLPFCSTFDAKASGYHLNEQYPERDVTSRASQRLDNSESKNSIHQHSGLQPQLQVKEENVSHIKISWTQISPDLMFCRACFICHQEHLVIFALLQ